MTNSTISGATSALRAAGGVHIERLNLVTCIGETFDLRALAPRLTLYEDLFSPCLTGHIVVYDASLLFENLPIVGEEKLQIKFYSDRYNDPDPFNYIEREFTVIAVRNLRFENDYTKTYVLDFASVEALQSAQIKVSKAFQNMPNSGAIAALMTGNFTDTNSPVNGLGFPKIAYQSKHDNDIRSQYLTQDATEAHYMKQDAFNNIELFIEKTKYQEPFITLAYDTPLRHIQRLATRSIRYASGYLAVAPITTFMFFENKRGFQFISLDSLLESKSAAGEIQFGQRTANVPSGNSDTGKLVNFDSAKSIRIDTIYDIMSYTQKGLYASRMFSFDIMTGTRTELEFDYVEGYMDRITTTRSCPDDAGATPFPPFYLNDQAQNPRTQRPDSRHIFVTQDYGNFNPITSLPTQKINSDYLDVEDYLQKKVSHSEVFDAFRLHVEVPGNSKHKVGDMIMFKWKETPPGLQERDNRYYSGYYLITAIQHVVSVGEYTMQIELVRDSFATIIGKAQTEDLVKKSLQHG